MYEVLNVCFGVIVILGQGYLLQYFLGSFLESRGKDRRRNGLLVMAGYGVLRLVLDEILPSDYESIRTVGKMALLFAAIVLLALLFYKGVHAITAFLGITFMAVSELTFFLSYMLLQAGGRLFADIRRGITDFLLWRIYRTAVFCIKEDYRKLPG